MIDDTILGAMAWKERKLQQLVALQKKRDWLILLFSMDESSREYHLKHMEVKDPAAHKAITEALDAMRQAAFDKATELLGIDELEPVIK